ncbi:hypothetical protein B0H11DRAFT_1909162 [Mycena galericulata]|nr:hypothetical protein B0H11DRAFT_1909162 [Mycena galericulata]
MYRVYRGMYRGWNLCNAAIHGTSRFMIYLPAHHHPLTVLPGAFLALPFVAHTRVLSSESVFVSYNLYLSTTIQSFRRINRFQVPGFRDQASLLVPKTRPSRVRTTFPVQYALRKGQVKCTPGKAPVNSICTRPRKFLRPNRNPYIDSKVRRLIIPDDLLMNASIRTLFIGELLLINYQWIPIRTQNQIAYTQRVIPALLLKSGLQVVLETDATSGTLTTRTSWEHGTQPRTSTCSWIDATHLAQFHLLFINTSAPRLDPNELVPVHRGPDVPTHTVNHFTVTKGESVFCPFESSSTCLLCLAPFARSCSCKSPSPSLYDAESVPIENTPDLDYSNLAQRSSDYLTNWLNIIFYRLLLPWYCLSRCGTHRGQVINSQSNINFNRLALADTRGKCVSTHGSFLNFPPSNTEGQINIARKTIFRTESAPGLGLKFEVARLIMLY